MFARCRAVLLSLAAFLLLGAAAIVGVSTPAAASATAPAASTDHVLSVLGAGPYRIGAKIDRLVAAGLVDQPSAPDANGNQVASSLGDWAGELLLTFHHGWLVVLETDTGSVRTAAGAQVGMSFDQVDQIYRGAGRLITNAEGRTAYLLSYGPMVMLFGDHPIRSGVGSITVGPRWITLRDFLN